MCPKANPVRGCCADAPHATPGYNPQPRISRHSDPDSLACRATFARSRSTSDLGGFPGIMSDLSVTLEALERSRSQLSVHTYFDAAVYGREMERIFQHSPRYLGHELSVPEIGDYQT